MEYLKIPGRGAAPVIFPHIDAGAKFAVGGMIIVQPNPHLSKVIGALGPPRSFSSRLHGRQEQRDEDGNDRDHHQKLNERKGGTAALFVTADFRHHGNPAEFGDVKLP